MHVVGGNDSQYGSHETLEAGDVLEQPPRSSDLSVRDVICLLVLKREQKANLQDSIMVLDHEIAVLRRQLPAPSCVGEPGE